LVNRSVLDSQLQENRSRRILHSFIDLKWELSVKLKGFKLLPSHNASVEVKFEFFVVIQISKL